MVCWTSANRKLAVHQPQGLRQSFTVHRNLLHFETVQVDIPYRKDFISEPNSLCTDASHLVQEFCVYPEIDRTMEVMPEKYPQWISTV